MLRIVIEKTKDGSDTLFVPELNEHYHSVNGAVTESKHVFIDAGLKLVLQQKKKINILEIGFGTGLNALLTCIEAQEHETIAIRYTGVEFYPLSEELINQLDFSLAKYDELLFQKIHACKWNNYCSVSSNFSLNKWQTDFTKEDTFNEAFDVVYFDAFAPDIQPEMWTLDVFQKLYDIMSANAVLTTYCAKGQVRRNMRSAGFSVERLPGPPGKREMLRATKKPV